MNFKELKLKNADDLKKMLNTERESLREQRFKSSQGQLKTVRQMRKSRKLIAQILTLLSACAIGKNKTA